jgi:hypothetical protein
MTFFGYLIGAGIVFLVAGLINLLLDDHDVRTSEYYKRAERLQRDPWNQQWRD